MPERGVSRPMWSTPSSSAVEAVLDIMAWVALLKRSKPPAPLPATGAATVVLLSFVPGILLSEVRGVWSLEPNPPKVKQMPGGGGCVFKSAVSGLAVAQKRSIDRAERDGPTGDQYSR